MAANGSYGGSDVIVWPETEEGKMAQSSADWNASNFVATDMDYYWYQSGRGNDLGERRAGSLWMGDLDNYMDETFLRQAFSHFGEYFKYVKVMKNKFTGVFMGYCFVEFDNEETALRILQKLNGRIIPNSSPLKRFKLNHANYGKEHSYNRNEYSLFVGDLSLDVDDLGLFKAFSSRYPSVRAAKVVLDVTGRSKGFGFIRFTDEYEQQQALAQMQNFMGLGNKPLRVSQATQKRPLPGTPPAPATTTTTTQADYNRYYQSYDQYQNYYSSWQDYSQYYNYAGYNYGQYGQYGYGSEYQQPAATAGTEAEATAEVAYDTTAVSGMTTAYDTLAETSGDEAELPYFAEHDIPLDMEKENQETVQNNQEFYTALEESRWTSIDYYRPLAIEAK